MKAKLSVQHLYKVFGKHPKKALKMVEQGKNKDEIFEATGQTVGVKDASFDIYEGEIFVIMGLSGSGKSTMVRMLNRLIEPTAGKVLLDDIDIAKLDDEELRQMRLHKMSMVFQSFALMPHLTVRQNVAFGLDLAGEVSEQEKNQRASSALDRVGLLANADSYPNELSGGMQQRVGLARALCINPDVLLMDEAFSALDPLIRTEMQDELLRLQNEDKRTIVFISHDLDEAVRIGDRIAIMQGGEVVQVGTPDDIINNPANDYVRSFFRGVDVTSVLSAKDIARKMQKTLIKRTTDSGVGAGLQLLRDNDREFGYVVEPDNTFVGVVSVDSLKQAQKNNRRIEEALLENVNAIQGNIPLGDLIGEVAQAPCSPPVINEDGKFLGAISKTILLEALDRQTEELA
ncbi:glycine betaine/L-proline ABC transporter ATP-binding protein ProV [Bermanella marisrubri]|uniref:Quaternary amine transport ATP-binding protein n=1 Tax=Bermanella marisrubri TaxID=207949 RepID=Q1N266_9GAMM|nr:glycine betaine/L-proline ABC transporter ATP-binding protein ProV [Bermanella marisrubri]EAT12298.1 ABC-type proline/glycine betaine transport system, ATPase component [Bermanella marisrubri]QIZ85386.1 glycine betaine/L-proline ABC transporter ATP-binding protein ProV [Bermanella marisrubri]